MQKNCVITIRKAASLPSKIRLRHSKIVMRQSIMGGKANTPDNNYLENNES